MTSTRTLPFLRDIAAAVHAGPLTRELARRWGLRYWPPRRDWVETLATQSRRVYPHQPEPRSFLQHNAHLRAETFPHLPSLAVLRVMPAVTQADVKRWGFTGVRNRRDSWRKVAEQMSRARYGNWEAQHGPWESRP